MLGTQFTREFSRISYSRGSAREQADEPDDDKPDGLEYDPNYSAIRPSAPAAHFSVEAGRDDEDVEEDDRSFFLPPSELRAAGAIPMARQVGREDLDADEQVDDRDPLELEPALRSTPG